MNIPVVPNPSVPKPASVIQAEAQASAENGNPGSAAGTAGWWNLTDLSGTLTGVIGAVQEAKGVPMYWKVAIVADLKVRCAAGDFNFVHLDAHFHTEKGNGVLHYQVRAERKLL